MPRPHSKERRDLAEFTTVGTPTCRRETRVIITLEGKYRVKVTSEAREAARVTRSTSKQRDRDTFSANEVRETRGSSITQWFWTTQWQSIPESFLEVSRPSCGKLPHWRRASDYVVAENYTAVLE